MRIATAPIQHLAAAWLLMLLCAAVNGQTPEKVQLGSTMTLEQLGASSKQAAEQTEAPLVVHAAAEPVPALKYRFSPELQQLKPGSALLHYSRAMLMFKNVPLDLRRHIDVGTEEPAPTPAELQKLLDATGPVFDEIHALALSEDFKWDHRIRDLRGAAVVSYLLPDVQEGRELARLLRRRIDDRLARGDFDGALASIEDGHRLAEFMASGETLIQQLVALAMQEVMREAVEDAIAKPGCPNLYWALASVHDLAPQMQRSIEFELSWFDMIFPMLPEAEARGGDEQYWQSRLQELVAEMRELDSTTDNLGFSVTVAAMTARSKAKQQLIDAGWKKEEVEAMPPTRALLIDTHRELRRWADELEKVSLLPYALSNDLSEQAMRRLDRWTAENRYQSVAASIASLLFPGYDGLRRAVARVEFQRHRLMVVEALRMHAAAHQGKLPKRLDELEPAPAPLNPFTNRPFDYQPQQTDRGVSIRLSGDLPTQYDAFKQLDVIIQDATLAP
ncbi:MAG: hypothetical protein ACTHK7_03065 [Aureliella sp.]